jgi:hypothetical protein
MYESVSKSFRTGCLERELQMAQLSATRCSCIITVWVSLVSFAAITLCVASQRVFIVVYFVIDWVRKLLNKPSYTYKLCHVKVTHLLSLTDQYTSQGHVIIFPLSWQQKRKHTPMNMKGLTRQKISIFYIEWYSLNEIPGKGKVVPMLFYLSTMPWRRNWESVVIIPRILDLGTRLRWVVSFTHRPLYPQGKNTWYPLDRRLGGSQSRSGRSGEEKNSQSPAGTRTPDHPARSPALYHWAFSDLNEISDIVKSEYLSFKLYLIP